MKTYIGLFRGINVGGKSILPMEKLVAVLEGLGLKDIRTYIQSGNVVFRGDDAPPERLAIRISESIQASHGFEPKVLLLDSSALDNAIRNNPYPEAETAPNTLHLNFLAEVPREPDIQGLNKIKTASERFHLAKQVCYLHAPEGIGRSKLAASLERLLGVAATSRNWNTVRKLKSIADARDLQ